MNGPERWRLDVAEGVLSGGHRFCVVRADGSHGRLCDNDQPVVVAARESTLAMVSASAGMRTADPRGALEQLADRLLRSIVADGNASGSSPSNLRSELVRLYEEGAFGEAVPSGVLLSVASTSAVSGVRFGPVGVAATRGQDVRWLQEDDRFPALRSKGIPLDAISPGISALDEALVSISSITQLDDADDPGGRLYFSADLSDESVLLMSRGATPFSLQGSPLTLRELASREAGWQHGMSGVVVKVVGPDERPRNNLDIWPVSAA